MYCPGNQRDVGSNPTTRRSEKWTLGGPLHRRFPSGPAGCKWKTNDVKLNYTCRKNNCMLVLRHGNFYLFKFKKFKKFKKLSSCHVNSKSLFHIIISLNAMLHAT